MHGKKRERNSLHYKTTWVRDSWIAAQENSFIAVDIGSVQSWLPHAPGGRPSVPNVKCSEGHHWPLLCCLCIARCWGLSRKCKCVIVGHVESSLSWPWRRNAEKDAICILSRSKLKLYRAVRSNAVLGTYCLVVRICLRKLPPYSLWRRLACCERELSKWMRDVRISIWNRATWSVSYSNLTPS